MTDLKVGDRCAIYGVVTTQYDGTVGSPSERRIGVIEWIDAQQARLKLERGVSFGVVSRTQLRRLKPKAKPVAREWTIRRVSHRPGGSMTREAAKALYSTFSHYLRTSGAQEEQIRADIESALVAAEQRGRDEERDRAAQLVSDLTVALMEICGAHKPSAPVASVRDLVKLRKRIRARGTKEG